MRNSRIEGGIVGECSFLNRINLAEVGGERVEVLMGEFLSLVEGFNSTGCSETESFQQHWKLFRFFAIHVLHQQVVLTGVRLLKLRGQCPRNLVLKVHRDRYWKSVLDGNFFRFQMNRAFDDARVDLMSLGIVWAGCVGSFNEWLWGRDNIESFQTGSCKRSRQVPWKTSGGCQCLVFAEGRESRDGYD